MVCCGGEGEEALGSSGVQASGGTCGFVQVSKAAVLSDSVYLGV